MYFYSGKLSYGKHTETDRFIFVNDFGYCKDYSKMFTYRENGRPDYQLIYVKNGTLVIHDKDKKHRLTAGDVCLFRPNEPQIYSIDGENTTHYWILFTGSEVEKILGFFKERSYHIGAFPEFEHFCQNLWSGFQAERESAELLLDGKLITIIAHISQFANLNEKKNIEVVNKICELLDELRPRTDGKSYAGQIVYVKDRPGHDMRYAIDADKIARELGWKPQESFESGIRKTVMWYLEHKDDWCAHVLSGEYKMERLGTGE